MKGIKFSGQFFVSVLEVSFRIDTAVCRFRSGPAFVNAEIGNCLYLPKCNCSLLQSAAENAAENAASVNEP